MKVHELIEKLKKLPQDALVMKQSFEGEENLPIWREVYYANFHHEPEYPNNEENVVVL